MNAALLLLAACMADAPVLVSTSECQTCGIVSGSSCGGCGFWKWMWGKKKECGHHIYCPHPGPIPGMEHPTLKQRIKDRLCPNHCTPPVSQTCPVASEPVIVEPAQPERLIMPKVSKSGPEKLRKMPAVVPAEEVTPVTTEPGERPH
jgi:hypothetical protein